MKSKHRSIIIGTLALCLFTSAAPRVAQAAVVSGKVSFEGEVPAVKPINFGAEKQCAMMHGDKMPVNEELVIGADKGVRWAFVYLKEGAAASAEVPSAPLEVDQKGCMFLPHVAVARVGQKVVFKNSDAVLHNVRSESKTNKAFNIAQPVQGMTTAKTFEKPEVGIKMRCDVHFWMASYVHVLDHPYYAVTGEDGRFELKDLPAGTYTVEVWHEKLGTQTAQVTVTDSETKTADFTLKIA